METLSGAFVETSGTGSSGSFHCGPSLARAQSGVKATQSVSMPKTAQVTDWSGGPRIGDPRVQLWAERRWQAKCTGMPR